VAVARRVAAADRIGARGPSMRASKASS